MKPLAISVVASFIIASLIEAFRFLSNGEATAGGCLLGLSATAGLLFVRQYGKAYLKWLLGGKWEKNNETE